MAPAQALPPAPCRIGEALDGRLMGAGWLGTGSILLPCVYGVNSTPLFSIQHTCEACQ